MNRRGIEDTAVVITMLIIGLVAASGITPLSEATTGIGSNVASAQSPGTTGFNSLAVYLATAQSPATTTGHTSNLASLLGKSQAASGVGENAQAFHTSPSNHFQSYNSSDLGFGIHYPSSWQVNDNQSESEKVVKFHAQDGSYFAVHVTSANGETLPQWTIAEIAWLKDRLHVPANATSTEFSDINGAGCTVNRLPHASPLSDQPAFAVTYKNHNGHQAAKIWTIKDGDVYVLTYVAPDAPTYISNLNTVMTMIKSFQISV